ncbi:MAG: T9SS type A sorting domain-containing protein [Flavobacteriales bacterium]
MSFKMVDALGNLVLKDQVYGSKKINTSEFRSGVYFITFEGSGSRPFVKKVIIRH